MNELKSLSLTTRFNPRTTRINSEPWSCLAVLCNSSFEIEEEIEAEPGDILRTLVLELTVSASL
jgi:hypothetical protein